jgi:nucleoside-diphosphate-sugar epimerase
MKLLVTGSTGFIGQALVQRLLMDGQHNVSCAVRSSGEHALFNTFQHHVGDIDDGNDWTLALQHVDVVVHLAARVHLLRDHSRDPLANFRLVNTHGTLNLARQAAAAGVRRLIFISSIGVNGGETFDRPYTPDDVPAPHSPYAVSKYEAELALQKLAVESRLEVTIVRPPLVYGPNAPGNFGSLMRWMAIGVPLPFGAIIHNRRSFVGLDNLVDFIVTCIAHPAAANQTFLISDGEDISTASLLQRMGRALGKPARLIPVPVGILSTSAILLGQRVVAQRLLGSLQLDIGKAKNVLGWVPPVRMDEMLSKAAMAWLSRHSK